MIPLGGRQRGYNADTTLPDGRVLTPGESWSGGLVQQVESGRTARANARTGPCTPPSNTRSRRSATTGSRRRSARRGHPTQQAARGRAVAPRTHGGTRGGVDANTPKSHLYELAKRLDVKGKSRMTKDQLVTAIEKANTRSTAKSRSRDPLAGCPCLPRHPEGAGAA